MGRKHDFSLWEIKPKGEERMDKSPGLHPEFNALAPPKKLCGTKFHNQSRWKLDPRHSATIRADELEGSQQRHMLRRARPSRFHRSAFPFRNCHRPWYFATWLASTLFKPALWERLYEVETSIPNPRRGKTNMDKQGS